MRRSLFEDHYGTPQQKLRLRPNLYARIAKFSYAHAWAVLCFWLALSIGLAVYAAFQTRNTPQTRLSFASSSISQSSLALLNENFPNLDSLIALNISNSDPQKLKLDRDNLLAKLNEDNADFEFVFSPGAGTYYDTHAILYHSLAEVKARVLYALSLRPLFNAIAQAPTAESLTTLVNEVSASIELGRDPQGLDALFSESAAAIQALIQGQDRQVDWTKVAGIDVEPRPTSSLVFVMPRASSQTAALAQINKIVDSLPKSEGTTTIVDQTADQNKKPDFLNPKQTLPWLIMTSIFLVFAFLILIGDLSLSAMIALPAICAICMLYGFASISVPSKLISLWSLAIPIGISTIQLSTRYSFSLLSVLQTTRSIESATMLAAQKQGAGLSLLGVATFTVWATYFGLMQHDFIFASVVMMGAIAIAILIVLTLVPAVAACFQTPPVWRSEEWVLLIFDALLRNRIWKVLNGALAVLAILVAAYGYWLSNTSLQNVIVKEDQSTVNLIAHSEQEAEAIIAKLKSVPEAQAVRWLGTFLPQEAEEKLVELQKLKDTFQKITPLTPTPIDILREQIATLEESLQAIANSQATRPELRDSAHDFRRSMELLTATSSDREVRALENRVFGSFNVVSDQADILANLDRPSLTTLDPELQRFFLSPANIYRIEISPVEGVTNAALAQKLAEQSFPVAHPSAVQGESTKIQKHFLYILLTSLAALTGLTFAIVTKSFGGFLTSATVALIGVGVVLAIAFRVQPRADFVTLISIGTLTGFLMSLIGSSFLRARSERALQSAAANSVESWLPTVLLFALLGPSLLLGLEPQTSRLVWLTIAICSLTLVSSCFSAFAASFLGKR